MPCTESKLKWQREHYKKNKHFYDEKQNRMRAQRREYIFSLLGNECAMCGEKDSSLFEIDHINPSKKTTRQSLLSLGRDKIDEELPNCQCLCKKCHKKKSDAQRKAAFKHFFSLPLDEQEQLLLEYY